MDDAKDRDGEKTRQKMEGKEREREKEKKKKLTKNTNLGKDWKRGYFENWNLGMAFFHSFVAISADA